MNEYVPLKAKDLKGFDAESRKLLLWAQEQGARLRVTANGHCFVYGPDGRTASVPPNLKSRNRSSQNSRAGIYRLFK